MCIFVSVYTWEKVALMPGKCWIPLELELQMAVRYPTGVLATKLGCFIEAVHILNCWTISPALAAELLMSVETENNVGWWHWVRIYRLNLSYEI